MMEETNPVPGPERQDQAKPPTPNPATPPPTPPGAGPEPAAPKVKKRRRWPWMIGVLLVLLLVLILIVPTVVSTGWGRSLVVGQVNQRLNGHIEVRDWSLGWNSGIRVDGLVVNDATGRQILQLPHLSTGLTIMDVLRGRYDLGKTVVDGLDVLVSREPDGSLNWEHMVKSGPKAAPSQPSAPKQPAPAKELPDVRGEVVVNDCNITYEDRSQQQPPVYLRSVQADVKIPDINQPITNSLSAQAQIASNPPGTILANGVVAAVKNKTIAINSATINETLGVKGLDLAAVSALLGPNLKLAGKTDGQLAIQLTNGTDGTVQAAMRSSGFAASGPKLNLKSDALTFQLPHMTINAPQGVGNLETAKFQIGDGRTTALTAQLSNASLIQGEGAAARPVLTGDTFTVHTAGNYTTGSQGRDLRITQLDVGDAQGIVSLKKAADQDVAVALPATGNPTASGKIDLLADLKRLNDAARAMSAPQVVVKDQSGMELRSGKFQGQITLGQGSAQQIALAGDFGISQLSVGNATAMPVQNEAVQITLRALANHDLSQVDVSQLDATGNLLSAHATDTQLNLSSGSGASVPLLQKVRKADVTVRVPSLTKVQTVMRALSPSTPATPAPAAGAAQAPPPADITSGSATFTLKADSKGQTLTLTQSLTLADLAFKRGSVAYNAGTIQLSALADVISAPATGAAAASLLDQIQELQVSQLHMSAPNIGGMEVSLPEPINVKDPGGLAQLLSPPTGGTARATGASVTGRVLIRGNPGPLMALMNTLSGRPATHQLDGGYAVDEQFATDSGGAISAKGRADLNDLVVDGQPNPEKAFRALSDVSLNGGSKTLDLRNLTLQASGTNALTLVMQGRITDLGGQQRIDNVLTADLSYDAGPLWKVILPFLSKDGQTKMKDAQVAGKYQKKFEVRGAFPSGEKFGDAVQKLTATGDVQLDLFDGQGVILKQVDVPVDLKGGVATIAYAGKPQGQNLPPPAFFNDGTLALGGCQVDLRGDHLQLTTPNNLKLVQHATLNPIFAAWSLGSVLNNPVFVGAKEATGILDVTIAECRQLPLDSSITSSNDGTATLDLSIKGLHVGNEFMTKVADVTRVNLASIQGNVKQYHVTIAHGIVNQDLVLTVGENQRPLRVFGDVRMADREMLPVTIDLPWKLLGIKGIDTNVQQFLPDGIQIPLRGKVSNPQFAFDFNKLIGDAAQKAVRQGILGGAGQGNNTTQPADQNPINELEKLLNQGKSRKKQGQ